MVLLSVLLFVGSYLGREWWLARAEAPATPEHHQGEPKRIIGLAPSTTEILFDLGLGDRVVGVSRHSNHPPEALTKPKVGVNLDIDFERLLPLEPDLVVMVESQHTLEPKFQRFGITMLQVDHASVPGILESMTTIGRRCGRADEAELMVGGIRGRMDAVSRRIVGRPEPRVLVCIERSVDSGKPERVFAAGSGGFHQELITLCGARNAYLGPIPYPMLSREQLIGLDPDVIIDLARDEFVRDHGIEGLRAQWSVFAELKAVRKGRIAIVAGTQHQIPGPRFIETLEAFADAIHPQEGD